MRKTANIITAVSAVAILLGTSVLSPSLSAAEKKALSPAEQGKKIAENRKKGNCFACHSYEGASLAGNIGPPLVAMKARFPDKKKLYNQVADATKANPKTVMPPFGRNEILTPKEINLVVEWLYTL